MNQPPTPTGSHVKAVLWGFLAGLPVGIILGWSMHGLIGFVLKSVLFMVCVVIVIGVAIVWKGSVKHKAGGSGSIVDVQWRSRGPSDGGRP